MRFKGKFIFLYPEMENCSPFCIVKVMFYEMTAIISFYMNTACKVYVIFVNIGTAYGCKFTLAHDLHYTGVWVREIICHHIVTLSHLNSARQCLSVCGTSDLPACSIVPHPTTLPRVEKY
jgi:hypothetical protein